MLPWWGLQDPQLELSVAIGSSPDVGDGARLAEASRDLDSQLSARQPH